MALQLRNGLLCEILGGRQAGVHHARPLAALAGGRQGRLHLEVVRVKGHVQISAALPPALPRRPQPPESPTPAPRRSHAPKTSVPERSLKHRRQRGKEKKKKRQKGGPVAGPHRSRRENARNLESVLSHSFSCQWMSSLPRKDWRPSSGCAIRYLTSRLSSQPLPSQTCRCLFQARAFGKPSPRRTRHNLGSSKDATRPLHAAPQSSPTVTPRRTTPRVHSRTYYRPVPRFIGPLVEGWLYKRTGSWLMPA